MSLSRLCVGGNNITDLTAQNAHRGRPGVACLCVCGNNITDLTPLDNVTGLAIRGPDSQNDRR